MRTPARHPARLIAAACIAMSAAAQANIVNGGFELSNANGSATGWTDTDSVFGYSRCDVASCGTGLGTAGPASGNGWIWFGGAVAAQTATLSQTTVLEAGSTALLFDFWTGATATAAQLSLSIDGNLLWSVTEATAAAYAGGYSTVSIALGGLADGGMHTVSWVYGDSDGGTTSNTNWSLDNVRLQAATAVPEPGSLALVGLAALGLAVTSRGRRQAA